MKTKLITIWISLTFLTSCVSNKISTLNLTDSVSMKGKTLAVIHEEKPSFIAMTSTNMIIASLSGGILGSGIMIYQGNKIVKNNQIEDPAYFISNNLSKDLQSKYGIKIIDKGLEKKTNNVSKIAKQYENVADYVLDVSTIGWGIIYKRFQLNSYVVSYGSKLRLIDVRNAKVIAESPCAKNFSQREISNPPTYKELLADNAKIIKEELIIGAEACSKLFKETILVAKAS